MKLFFYLSIFYVLLACKSYSAEPKRQVLEQRQVLTEIMDYLPAEEIDHFQNLAQNDYNLSIDTDYLKKKSPEGLKIQLNDGTYKWIFLHETLPNDAKIISFNKPIPFLNYCVNKENEKNPIRSSIDRILANIKETNCEKASKILANSKELNLIGSNILNISLLQELPKL